MHRERAGYREGVTDEVIGKMLARDINVPIVVDGTAYFLPGGGLTVAGTSGEVELRASRTLDEIEYLEQALTAKGAEIRDYIAYKYGVCLTSLALRCVMLGDDIAIYEECSKKLFTYQNGNFIGIG